MLHSIVRTCEQPDRLQSTLYSSNAIGQQKLVMYSVNARLEAFDPMGAKEEREGQKSIPLPG
uniref:Uncharacterized protein n=1 Tax=Arundo donax TaxID=35708 RepID=A0A0A9H664_ARUDO